jgi:phosphoglycerol transferase MdoB-like AlkP superfamily enzyme
VLVTIESFSAKYMGSNGDGRNLTPNLDALRKQSLYFNNFYATGTRTDRGLEAITLAIPPTPGARSSSASVAKAVSPALANSSAP